MMKFMMVLLCPFVRGSFSFVTFHTRQDERATVVPRTGRNNASEGFWRGVRFLQTWGSDTPRSDRGERSRQLPADGFRAVSGPVKKNANAFQKKHFGATVSRLPPPPPVRSGRGGAAPRGRSRLDRQAVLAPDQPVRRHHLSPALPALCPAAPARRRRTGRSRPAGRRSAGRRLSPRP